MTAVDIAHLQVRDLCAACSGGIKRHYQDELKRRLGRIDQARNFELGFQSLLRNAKLPKGWGDIATFTRRKPKNPGIGTALFQHTLAFAKSLELVAINATIRSDNYSGIPYHEKMGFKTYNIAVGLPLKDGTPVDRISKIYSLA